MPCLPGMPTAPEIPNPPLVPFRVGAGDDLGFVTAVAEAVTGAAARERFRSVRVVQIDGWFGPRWLGFCGKWRGAAGVRMRRVNDARMPVPPFRPSRVVDERRLRLDGRAWREEPAGGPLHVEKNGGAFHELLFSGLYVWYSGGTAAEGHTTGSLIVTEVDLGRGDGWYAQFDRPAGDAGGRWLVGRVANITRPELAALRAVGSGGDQGPASATGRTPRG